MIKPIERRDKPNDPNKRYELPAPKGHRHSASSREKSAEISFEKALEAAMAKTR